MALVLDTGPIVALLDARDTHHAVCVALIEATAEDLVIPQPVLVEVDYWVRKSSQPDAWQTFVEDVSDGAYRVDCLEDPDLHRAAELQRIYSDLDLGFVDASVVATCERLGESKVATLDRRHFSIVRPRHRDALRIVPEPAA